MGVRAVETLPQIEVEPVWEIAFLFPEQGQWGEEEYLALTTNHLVEYSHGLLEVLSMPTRAHQRLVAFLFRLLADFVEVHDLGEVFFAPYRVQLWPGKYREPDLVYLTHERVLQSTEAYAVGADLAVEVVSEDAPMRDLQTKRREYAQAAIPEYWIVDPRKRKISVLRLEERAYVVSGDYGPGEQALSVLLPGFGVDVAAGFAAAD